MPSNSLPDLGAANTIFLPLDQAEMAAQPNIDQLLPLRAYERITALIESAVPHALPSQGDEGYLPHRIHNAILVDGKRGSGKSTIIVNLASYIAALPPRTEGRRLADEVHVLRPIDPSQLEDEDDLFLNVVVAAVLGDNKLQDAQAEHPTKRAALQNRLQELGRALESRQSQSGADGDRGLDRLRNFVGSQGLARAVHDFFVTAADVLDKKLLVLPIDDVDTTLHRAYENLEVVRRYLATPVVLPVLCGDLHLFDEVIWRDTCSRLTRDSATAMPDAQKLARDLAHEYQRKVFPARGRVQMPGIEEILRDRRIVLTRLATNPTKPINEPLLSLRFFRSWLHTLLVGPVNGLESSGLELPVRTLRALAQLVTNVRELVPDLSEQIKKEPGGPLERLLQRVNGIIDGNVLERESSTPSRKLVSGRTTRRVDGQFSSLADALLAPGFLVA